MEKKKVNIYSREYQEQCRFSVPSNVRDELYDIEWLFRNIVGTLITLDDKALADDPERKWNGLSRAEGGLIFKNAAVVFQHDSATFKDSEIPLKKQNPIYNIITAKIINQLCDEFSRVEGKSAKERLVKASLRLLNDKIPTSEFIKEVENKFFMGNSWDGFFGFRPDRYVIGNIEDYYNIRDLNI